MSESIVAELSVESWPVDRPQPYPGNPREISETAIAKVAASIEEYGWRQPIVVDGGGVIVAGHARLLAAQKLGLTEVPIHVAEGLSEAQVKAYRLADNRTGEEAGWDMEALRVELTDLSGVGVDLGLTGFSADELNALVSPTGGHTGEDEAPGLPDAPVTRSGDVWACGGHRLLCGDATKAEDVERLLSGVAPHLMVTDPPYGVGYDPGWRNKARRASKGPRGWSKDGKVKNDDRADWREAWALFSGEAAYVWHGGLYASLVAESLGAAGFHLRCQIIWVKQHFVLSRGDYHWQHEPCWYAVRSKGHWSGGRKQTTVWHIKNRNAFGGKSDDVDSNHGTQKPVECMRRPMENNSSPGQAVYDPFLGSGTSMIAAETIGRVCYGIEIDPGYCDVAVRRWQDFAGEAATLEDDDRTFAEITEERGIRIHGTTRAEANPDAPKTRPRQPGKAKDQTRRRAAGDRAADAAAASQ